MALNIKSTDTKMGFHALKQMDQDPYGTRLKMAQWLRPRQVCTLRPASSNIKSQVSSFTEHNIGQGWLASGDCIVRWPTIETTESQ